MRTTLDIDRDVLTAAKELASSQGRTAGKVISELARKGLMSAAEEGSGTQRNGFELVPVRAGPVTVDLIESLLEEEG